MPCLAGFSEASTRYQNQTLKGSYPPLAPPISWILSSTSAKGQWKAWNMLRGALHGRSKVHLWSRKVRKIFVKGIHCHCRFVSFFPISIRVIIFKQKTSCWVTIVAWFCAFLVCILLFFLVFFGACLLLHGNPSLTLAAHAANPIQEKRLSMPQAWHIYGCFLKWWVFPPFPTPKWWCFSRNTHGFVGVSPTILGNSHIPACRLFRWEFLGKMNNGEIPQF